MDDLSWLDATALAQLVAAGELTNREVIDHAISRAELLGGELGCVAERLDESARRAAESVHIGTSSLAGAPMMLKDHLATAAGVRHTSGSRFPRDYRAPEDSELVSRFRAGGLIPIATSTTSEFALLATGESERYGPCRNPWELSRIAGGSSGGSAAAVAAGIVPVAHGNDAGGSIRIPASACGVFGLKPSRGRTPLDPQAVDIAAGLWSEHVLTRSVRDSLAVLDLVGGGACLGSLLRARPDRLRIGVTAATDVLGDIATECTDALDATTRLCEGLGHHVEEVALPFDDILELETAFFALYSAGAARYLENWVARLGRTPEPGELEPYTEALVQRGREVTDSGHRAAFECMERGARSAAAFHDTYDVLLTPTVASPPLPLGHFTKSVGDDSMSPLYVDADYSRYTWFANATGQPAMSMPLYWDASGLPIGTHFTAASGREDLLFRLAFQLEEAQPWNLRRPPV